MAMLDGLLSQVAQNVDVANLATKVGISEDQAEAAIAALGHAHGAPGDTVATAAAATDLPTGVLERIVAEIGGEGSLTQFASLLRDSGGADGILGKLGGLFGRD